MFPWEKPFRNHKTCLEMGFSGGNTTRCQQCSVVRALEVNKISNFRVETGKINETIGQYKLMNCIGQYSPLSQYLWCAGPGFCANLDLLLTQKSVKLVMDDVKLGVRTEMSGPKLCEALASTCRLRRSLAGCLEFRRSGRSRRVRSRAEKKLKKTRAS